jgi:hypothetical protein
VRGDPLINAARAVAHLARIRSIARANGLKAGLLRLEASCARDLDPEGHREFVAELLRAAASPGHAVAVLGEPGLILVCRGNVIRAARDAAEDHDVAAVAVAVEGRATRRRSTTWLMRFALAML